MTQNGCKLLHTPKKNQPNYTHKLRSQIYVPVTAAKVRFIELPSIPVQRHYITCSFSASLLLKQEKGGRKDPGSLLIDECSRCSGMAARIRRLSEKFFFFGFDRWRNFYWLKCRVGF